MQLKSDAHLVIEALGTKLELKIKFVIRFKLVP